MIERPDYCGLCDYYAVIESAPAFGTCPLSTILTGKADRIRRCEPGCAFGRQSPGEECLAPGGEQTSS